MVYILTDPNYSASIWCKLFLSALTDTLKKDRIPHKQVTDVIPADAEDVFLIAADYDWIRKAVKRLNQAAISPILICNHSEPLAGCDYSSVSSDMQASMKFFLEGLSAERKKGVALYGVNTRSISDIGKVDTLFSYKDIFFEDVRIYHNDGSLKVCYTDFCRDLGSIDTVICTNDFAAISLVKHLEADCPEALERLTVFSLGDCILTEHYRRYIRSVALDCSQYGRAALFLYKSRKKHRFLSNISIKVTWNPEAPRLPRDLPLTLSIPQVPDSFYGDEELSDMMKLEKLLRVSDETDRIILVSLSERVTWEQLLSRCYLTENAVKYRIKKLLAESGIANKAELRRLWEHYIGERPLP